MKTVVVFLIALALALPAAADRTAAEMGPFQPNGVVALFTDYGPDSIDAGQLTGAALRKAADVRITVLSNAVPPFDVSGGSYLLVNTFTSFPKGTVFACNVGGNPDAKLMVMRTQTDHVFVAPDNGLLMLVAATHGAVELFEATNQALWQLSDIPSDLAVGPGVCGAVAAAIASGTPLKEAGEPLRMFQQLTLEPSRVEEGIGRGEVLFVDAHGNVITNMRQIHLRQLGIEPGGGASITIGGETTALDYVASPGDVPPGDRYMWINHFGCVTLGANGYSFAEAVGGAPHQPVAIESVPGEAPAETPEAPVQDAGE